MLPQLFVDASSAGSSIFGRFWLRRRRRALTKGCCFERDGTGAGRRGGRRRGGRRGRRTAAAAGGSGGQKCERERDPHPANYTGSPSVLVFLPAERAHHRV